LSISPDGEVKTLIPGSPDTGHWSVYDLMVDAKEDVLWVSSTAVILYKGQNANNAGKSGLFKYDLSSNKLLQRFLLPNPDGQPVLLKNMVLGNDGTVYATDGNRPVIYQLKEGDEAPAVLIASPELISLGGLAFHPSLPLLYIADIERGIMIADLATGRFQPIRVPATLALGGIEGLSSWDNYLVIIQNGILPERVMRLELDPTGREVINVRPLLAAHPAFDMPTHGTVAGTDLYLFANSQRKNLTARGLVEGARPVTILKTSLSAGADLVNPELDKIMRKIRQGDPAKAPGSDSDDAASGRN
jgi:hypothetical protein